MKLLRRQFLHLGVSAAGATAAWPVGAYAQQPGVPVIGYLTASTPEANPNSLAGLRKGLVEIGYVEGRNLAIEYRFAHDEYGRLPELAADLVSRKVNVIVALQAQSALAAMAATTTVPILFSTAGEPVWGGLVSSLNRPGGNVTGVTSLGVEATAKRIGLLYELLPSAARFAVLYLSNP